MFHLAAPHDNTRNRPFLRVPHMALTAACFLTCLIFSSCSALGLRDNANLLRDARRNIKAHFELPTSKYYNDQPQDQRNDNFRDILNSVHEDIQRYHDAERAALRDRGRFAGAGLTITALVSAGLAVVFPAATTKTFLAAIAAISTGTGEYIKRDHWGGFPPRTVERMMKSLQQRSLASLRDKLARSDTSYTTDNFQDDLDALLLSGGVDDAVEALRSLASNPSGKGP